MSEMSDMWVLMTMMHNDDEKILHDRDGGHHVKCTQVINVDAENVVDEHRSASSPFQNLFTTTHHRPAIEEHHR